MTPSMLAAAQFYEDRYDMVFDRLFCAGDKLELGDRINRKCRFCGREPPEARFRKIAHAVPQSLGNRGLTSTYECDACNLLFGKGIENDLGEWSLAARTLARIKGAGGLPKLKQGPGGRSSIVATDEGIVISAYEDYDLFSIEQDRNGFVLKLRRGPYTPVSVFKAFVKIGLTLMPEHELMPFKDTLAWVRNPDHARSWVRQATIFHTVQNGPARPDLLVLMVLRRKAGVTGVPYAYLILGYGHDVYQVPLPAREEDRSLSGTTFGMVAFPTPGGMDPERYGYAPVRPVDLTGMDVVRNDRLELPWRYEEVVEGPVGETINSD